VEKDMSTKHAMTGVVLGVSLSIGFALGAQDKKQAKDKPMTFALDCAGGDCPLLKGAPQTRGMRGGSVRLKPGESVGWHSTGEQEEVLVVLHGRGAANIEGQTDVPVHEKMLGYIPPETKHNVTNTGTEILEYVWVVAPIRQK
jgi:quercetin dioxygenase-like cupin family protein